MKKNKLTQKDWLEYLNNLNNREIRKRNSSGFTTWALFGLIAFLLLKLIDSLPIIYMDIENVFLFKLFITNIFNLFTVILFFAVASSLPRKEKRKIYTELMKKFFIFSGEIICFIFIVGILSNISIAVNLKFYGLSILPYCVFAIFEIIFVISYTIIRITTKKEDKLPRFDSGYMYIIKGKNPLKYTYVFLGLVFSSFFLFSIYQIKQNYYFLNYLSILESGFYLIVLIIAIIWLMVKNVVLIKNTWLEELERKIMIQNLGEKEIVKAFINEFVGKDITQWLKEIKDETKEEETRVIILFNKIEKEINSLNPKVIDLNKEIMKVNKLTDKIIELDKLIDKYLEKFSNNTNNVSYFLKQGPLSNEEVLLIEKFTRARKKNIRFQKATIAKKSTWVEKLDKYVETRKKLIKPKEK